MTILFFGAVQLPLGCLEYTQGSWHNGLSCNNKSKSSSCRTESIDFPPNFLLGGVKSGFRLINGITANWESGKSHMTITRLIRTWQGSVYSLGKCGAHFLACRMKRRNLRMIPLRQINAEIGIQIFRVAVDENEGVVKAQNSRAVFVAPRRSQRRWRTKTLEVSR